MTKVLNQVLTFGIIWVVSGKIALLWGQIAFNPIDTLYTAKALVTPHFPIKYNVLFKAGDTVVTVHGKKVPSKDKFDFMAYIPINGSSEGLLWVNHETVGANDALGDGGGATLLHIKLAGEHWRTNGNKRAVDFSTVGGTYNNCLGGVTPKGTIFTCEEYEPNSNQEIYLNGQGIRDTMPYRGYAKYLNYGWVVEVDPKTGQAIDKRWAMGRFSHEAALCLPDRRTVYMTDDFAPGCFFKFVADKPDDYANGQLYAYQKLANGGQWLPIPRTRQALNQARTEAFKLGATIFFRLEDVELLPDGRLILTETGVEHTDITQALALGGQLAPHLSRFRLEGNAYKDPYGRIHVLDTVSNVMSIFLEGGAGKLTLNHLANPDNISIDRTRNVLVIHEDINSPDDGRVPSHLGKTLFNDIYFLDLSIKNPTVDDLVLFAISPPDAETTGSCWTPDYNALFFNVQHPSKKNLPPFNKDCTIVVTGFRPALR